MRRREFIAGLGGAVAWPLAARAQQSAVPVVGLLDLGPPRPDASYVTALRQGLAEAGFVEGRTVAIEYRWANSQEQQLAPLATELVQRQVTVIVPCSGPSVLAAQAATSTIPIIFGVFSTDPIKFDLVASLSRPGGNMTGISSLSSELIGKRLDLLRKMAPLATPLRFRREAFRSAGLANPYCAFRTAFLRRGYHQILWPHRYFAKLADVFCRHADVSIHLNPHGSRQATKSYLERGNASGPISHVVFAPIGTADCRKSHQDRSGYR
jgi:ABC transporter substrate binding protein